MSVGNPKVIVRFTQDMLDVIETTIERRNKNTSRPPWTVSDFLRAAVAEKLDHMRRARRRKASNVPDTDGTNSGLSAPQEDDRGGP